jgi:hypothetical protein
VEPDRAANALALALDMERRGGDISVARGYFKKVVTLYPGTPEAIQAEKWLEQNVAQSIATPGALKPNVVQLVRVVDIDISFGQLVALFVKASIALIPAAIILGAFGLGVALVIGAIANAGS